MDVLAASRVWSRDRRLLALARARGDRVAAAVIEARLNASIKAW